MQIRIATETDIPKLLSAFMELRPHRTSEEITSMLKMQFNEGYQLVYLGDDTMAYALGGFRILNFVFSGKTLYVDDLVTHSQHKKHGYARKLLEWMKEYAKQQECETFSLDSGFNRKDAYRVYLNFGLEVSSLHFQRKLSEF